MSDEAAIITPAEFGAMARRWWWVIVPLTLLAGLAGFGFARYQKPVYNATETFLVGPAVSASGEAYSDVIGTAPSVKTFSELVTMRPVLERVLTRIPSSESLTHLAARIKVTPQLDTQILQIAVRDPDPQQAARVANIVGEEFLKWLTEQQDASSAQSDQVLRANLTRTQGDLATVTAQITALQSTPVPRRVDEDNRITNLQSLQSLYQTNAVDLINQQQRLNLAQIAGRNRVRVVTPATPPLRSSNLPTLAYVAIGALLGLALALLAMMLTEWAHRRIRTPDDVRRVADVPVIATLPHIRVNDPLGVESPRSRSAEAIRSLRTRLQFATYGNVSGIVVVTSPRPYEGRSLVAANLAMALAQGGRSVILVDGNLRQPSLARRFAKPELPGLVNLLQDAALSLDDVLVKGPHPALSLLFTGTSETNGPALLTSNRLHPIMLALGARAEIVLINAPALLPVSDAMLFTAEADHTVLLVRNGQTSPEALRVALARARETGTHVAGVVLFGASRFATVSS